MMATAPRTLETDAPRGPRGEVARRALAVVFSQSGQTSRAVNVFIDNVRLPDCSTVTRYPLEEDSHRYPVPWPFLAFVRALPNAIAPARRSPPSASAVPLPPCDTLILGYPVWFLSPAAPMAALLRHLPDGSLAGKDVITICTCRNMWVEAQKTVRALVEAKGGRVVSHVTLMDRGSNLASLITTPRFFLTGKRRFEAAWLRRLLPEFGVGEEQYAGLAVWARTYHAGDDGRFPSRFDFDVPLAVAEAIGRRIFRVLVTPWPLFRDRSRTAQGLYLLGLAACSAVAILTLMPPVVILAGLPPIRRRLWRWSRLLTSVPSSPGHRR